MAKITKVNTGGGISSFVGCALTGTCGTGAADYVKTVGLSDADAISDGMFIACEFTDTNSAGNAPVPQTVYSSDQQTYYSDSGLTVPVTLPPDGCYEIEYTGSGNEYTLLTYVVISVGEVSGPLCNAVGRITGGALWAAGDIVLLLYTGGKFLAINV